MTGMPGLAEIQALEEALHRPEIRRSRAAVEDLLSEGFVEFGSSGAVWNREEIIDLLVNEDSPADESDLETSDYTLLVISEDAVLLTYRTRRSNPDGSARKVLRSSIWKRVGLQWKMLFHQGTVENPPGIP